MEGCIATYGMPAEEDELGFEYARLWGLLVGTVLRIFLQPQDCSQYTAAGEIE